MHCLPLVRVRARATFATLLLIVGASLEANLASAALISYGDFSIPPAGITFLNVTESSGTDPVPLFGPPHVPSSPLGLDFDPAGFVSAATGGDTDFTDGQLNFTLMGTFTRTVGVGLNTFSLFESGDYTLQGIGTTATQVLAGASITVKVTEVDGVPIMPITFSSIASFGANLTANPGIVQPWSGSTSVAIAAGLTALNIPYTVGATKAEILIDNQLLTFSESGSAAFIAKKDFVLGVVTDTQGELVPEPASLVLGAMALGAFGLIAYRRQLRL